MIRKESMDMKKSSTNKISQGSVAAIVLTGFLFVALVSGCATTKPADFIATGFDCADVDSVQVLPVLDLRVDQSEQLDLDKLVFPIAENFLEDRGYPYTLEPDRSFLSDISRDDLEAPTREFITSLPPAPAKWVLVLSLDASSTELGFGATGNAEMSGYLFDKQNGQLTWRNKELGRVGQGGLIGLAMQGLMEESAIQQANRLVFQALPYRNQ